MSFVWHYRRHAMHRRNSRKLPRHGSPGERRRLSQISCYSASSGPWRHRLHSFSQFNVGALARRSGHRCRPTAARDDEYLCQFHGERPTWRTERLRLQSEPERSVFTTLCASLHLLTCIVEQLFPLRAAGRTTKKKEGAGIRSMPNECVVVGLTRWACSLANQALLSRATTQPPTTYDYFSR